MNITELKKAADHHIKRGDSMQMDPKVILEMCEVMGQGEPVAHAVIAGVLFDFMGWLTSRDERIVLSSRDDASPAVNVIQQFSEMRGFSLDGARVQDWQTATHPAQPVQPVERVSCSFPERDNTKPAEEQGLFRKFDVHRVDGSHVPGGKHHGCEYFVLDISHDTHAPAALRAYAEACKDSHPKLSAELAARFGTRPVQPAGAQGGFSWATGEPPKWFEEWFIAKLDNGQRVVLKRLPEDFTYDYTTADETYYAKRRIAKWMQFHDSEFVSLNPGPAAAQSWELDEESCKFLADMITADPDQITRVGFHLGYAKDDDGKLVHGFSVYEAEYPEEGVHTLVETSPSEPVQPAVAQEPVLLVDHCEFVAARNEWRIISYAPVAVPVETKLYTAPPAAAINEQILNALKLYIAHAGEPECAIWRHVQAKVKAAIAAAEAEKARGRG